MITTPLAIDFGTTNSLAGIAAGADEARILPLDPFNVQDASLFRSLVYFPHANQAYYGSEAIHQYLEQNMDGRLFRSFKAHLPNAAYLGTMVETRRLPLEELVGTFLLELRRRSEKILDAPVETAVFGRPAKYSMDEVQHSFAVHRMNKAIEFAGFKKWVFVPEPLAAALNFRQHLSSPKLVLIGDFGGGTSDFTVMKMSPDSFSETDILAIHGCSMAGDAFDSSMMKNRLNLHFGAQSRYQLPMSTNVLNMPPHIRSKLDLPAHIVHLKERETFEFIRNVEKCTFGALDKKRIQQLMVLVEDQQIFQFFEKIEWAKRRLSDVDAVDFEFLYPGIEVREEITRTQFEEWSSVVESTIAGTLQETLEIAGAHASEIDLICLTGGTAKVPRIRRMFEELFGEAKLRTTTEFHSVIGGLVSSAPLWAEGRLPFETFGAK